METTAHRGGGRARGFENASPVLWLLAVLFAAPLLLGGCAVSIMGKRIGLPARGDAPHESSLQKDLREMREAAVLAPAAPYWPYRIAELYESADSLARAESALEQSLARDPAYAPALALRASFDYRAGRHERAIQSLEAALARHGAYPEGPPRELVEGLALHYEALGRDEKARQLLEASPSRKRDAAPAMVYLTLLGPAPETAAAIAESAVRDDSKSAANQNNFGITRLRAGDPFGARKAFEKAAQLDSSLAGPFYNLAILEKYYLFNDEAAGRWFARYWGKSQDDPDGLATVFGKSARRDLAQDED
jgi:tetratricopeptide (TPR) repeat protein